MLSIGPPMLAGAWWMLRQPDEVEEWSFAPTEFHPNIIWDDVWLERQRSVLIEDVPTLGDD